MWLSLHYNRGMIWKLSYNTGWHFPHLPCYQSQTVRTVSGFPTKNRAGGKSDGFIWPKTVRITRGSGLTGSGLPSGYCNRGSVSTIGKCGVGRYMRHLSVARYVKMLENSVFWDVIIHAMSLARQIRTKNLRGRVLPPAAK